MPSPHTIGRLSLYRSILMRLMREGEQGSIYSHQLAGLAGVTPSQVRRDLMVVGYVGSAAHGYGVGELAASIGQTLDSPVLEAVALVGVGNMGRAILAFFAGRRPNLRLVVAFDRDPHKVGRIFEGVRCYPVEDLERMVREKRVRVAVLAVPAQEAQGVAESLVAAGVRGILNFAPVRLRVPADVWVENVDMAVSLEKTAFFARAGAPDESAS